MKKQGDMASLKEHNSSLELESDIKSIYEMPEMDCLKHLSYWHK